MAVLWRLRYKLGFRDVVEQWAVRHLGLIDSIRVVRAALRMPQDDEGDWIDPTAPDAAHLLGATFDVATSRTMIPEHEAEYALPLLRPGGLLAIDVSERADGGEYRDLPNGKCLRLIRT